MRAGAWLGMALIALLCAAAPATAAPTGPFSQGGRWITDAKGRVALLHGVNMVYKLAPYQPSVTGFGADDADFLAREGFNTVRLGVIYKAVEPRPGRYDDAYLDGIERTVNLLARRGIFTLLDFHQDLYNERFQGEGWPDWAVQDDGLAAQPKLGFPTNYLFMPALWRAFDHFWQNDPGPGGVGLQDRYAAAWRHVAGRFRGNAGLVGYDLLNEPWPGSQWPTCIVPTGCGFDQTRLTPFSRRATNAIRRADPRTLVWYEPNVIFNNGAATLHGDTGPRAGMSFHIYCLPEGFTSRPSPLDPLQQVACDVFEELPFQRAEDQSRRTGDALLLSEFGATDDLGQIERVVDRAQAHRVGWQYWHYCACGDPTTSGAGGTQELVIDPRRAPTGANVRGAKLDVLARAYPQAVAGVPERYRWDRRARRFELSYATRRLGGGSFALGADTQVALPRRQFPRGYDVVARGAEPLSGPGERALRLRNCTGRGRVEVVVTPAASGGGLRADCRAPRGPARRPALRMSVRPRTARAGRRVRLRFHVVTGRGRARRAVRGARVTVGRRAVRTNRRGRASLRVRPRRWGTLRIRATRRGYRSASARVRVR